MDWIHIVGIVGIVVAVVVGLILGFGLGLMIAYHLKGE